MRTEKADGDWSELVTDGHVRAARLRFMQPWLIALGVAALLVGFYLWAGVVAPEAREGSSSAMTEVETARAPVEAALSGLPSVNVPTDTARTLPNASEIGSTLVPMVLAELKKSDRLPVENLELRTLTAAQFWGGPWPNGALVVTGSDGLKLVGGIVNTSPADSWPTAGRWLGVFSKRDGVWRYATAEGPGFVDVRDQPSVALPAIPLTLAPALPKGN